MDSSLVIGMTFPDLVLYLTSRRILGMLQDRIQNGVVSAWRQLDGLLRAAFVSVKKVW